MTEKVTLSYLNRSLMWASHSIVLATSADWFATAMKLLGGTVIKHDYDKDAHVRASARCMFMRSWDDCPVVIVCLDAAALEAIHPAERIVALLAHECMHILQATWREIGEDCPGDEIEAYAIQSLLEEVLVEYGRQRAVDGVAS